MQIIQHTTEFKIEEKTAVALGKFDGIHRGHKQLLEKILEMKSKGLKTAIFTFSPSPASFFQNCIVKELSTKQEKEAMFEELGIDILIEFPLNKETAAMEPEQFVSEILMKQMNVAFVAAGSDLSFGNKGRGDAKLLAQFAKDNNFTVEIIDKVCHEGREISSSFVREEVEKGNMELVTKLIGAPYFVSGTVLHGNRIGRTLGFPTVNLIPDEEKLLPPCGVYYSTIQVEGKIYNGVTNIGYKPTVSETESLGVETYIYDFSDDVYGKEIKVSLEYFKRPEQKFGSFDELKRQIQQDKEDGFVYFAEKM